jgi:septal ring factor EnvC (AmiA/AmiB activator)
VKNKRGAYLAALLREGVAGRSSYEKDKEALLKNRREFERKRKELEELARRRAEEERKLKNLEFEERFDNLAEEDRAALLSEFEDSLERFQLRYFYKDGIRSVAIRGSFLEFLEKKFDRGA